MSEYMNIRDLRRRVGIKLVEAGYYCKEIEEQKKLLDQELKLYLSQQINYIKGKQVIDIKKIADVQVTDLVEILGSIIPKKDHYDTLGQLTHYIINIAGEMQGYGGILWCIESDKNLITTPIAEFGKNGTWDKIVGHEKTPYVKMFNSTYDVFQNQFQKKLTNKKKVYTSPKINIQRKG